MSQEITVSLQRKGPLIDLDMESQALGKIHVDNNALPEEERAGSAKKLLGASVLYCYVAALDKALKHAARNMTPLTRRPRSAPAPTTRARAASLA